MRGCIRLNISTIEMCWLYLSLVPLAEAVLVFRCEPINIVVPALLVPIVWMLRNSSEIVNPQGRQSVSVEVEVVPSNLQVELHIAVTTLGMSVGNV